MVKYLGVEIKVSPFKLVCENFHLQEFFLPDDYRLVSCNICSKDYKYYLVNKTGGFFLKLLNDPQLEKALEQTELEAKEEQERLEREEEARIALEKRLVEAENQDRIALEKQKEKEKKELEKEQLKKEKQEKDKRVRELREKLKAMEEEEKVDVILEE